MIAIKLDAKLEPFQIDVLPVVRDALGALTIMEFSQFLPFAVARLFYVGDVPPNSVRGQHAHYRCSQYMVCQRGRIRIDVTDGEQDKSVTLSAGHAVLVKPGIFATETYLDADSLLMVLCDRPYEKDDYVHTLNEFLKLRRS